MREKVIENKLSEAVRYAGGLALKLVSPGFNGVPDRLLLLMGGKAAFVEVKAPGEKPRPLQVHRFAQLRKLGFRVYVLDDVEQIPKLIEKITADKDPAPGFHPKLQQCHPERSEGSPPNNTPSKRRNQT